MRTITLEEHFASPAWLEGPGRETGDLARNPQNPLREVPAKLVEIGKQRLAEMDAAGIDMQVLSLNSPGVEQLSDAEAVAAARETNEFLATAVHAYPDRFGGFAALSLARPEEAATELERTVHDFGFKGAVINGHIRERYLDDHFFWPVLEAAEALGVPIYLHPTQPPKAVVQAYYSGFSPQVDDILSKPGWGWHIETAVHLIRMILGGVFDRWPNLQVIVGHLGIAFYARKDECGAGAAIDKTRTSHRRLSPRECLLYPEWMELYRVFSESAAGSGGRQDHVLLRLPLWIDGQVEDISRWIARERRRSGEDCLW